MATAEKKPVNDYTVVLTLNANEAELVRAVFNIVFTSEVLEGPAYHIWKALDRAGVKSGEWHKVNNDPIRFSKTL